MAQIILPPQSKCKPVLDLLIRWCKTDITLTENDKTLLPELVEKDGKKTFGFTAIALKIVEQSKNDKKWKEAVLPSKPAELVAQILQYLELTESFLEAADEKTAIGQIQNILRLNTFVVGTSITVADVALLAAVYPFISGLPSKEKVSFNNVIRWADHICFLVDTGYKPLEIEHMKIQIKQKKEKPKAQQKPEQEKQ